MGFDGALASRALRRAHNNFDDALTMLTAGMVPEEDEFDVLAEEDAKGSGGGSTPAAKPVMVAETKKSDDTFSEGVKKGAPASAHIDSRISSLMAMGFTAEDVETALKASVCMSAPFRPSVRNHLLNRLWPLSSPHSLRRTMWTWP